MPKNDETARLESLLAEIAKKDREIADLRYNDPLTKLPNRAKLEEEMLKGGKKAILIADINQFSMINAVYGPRVADYVIVQAAAIIRHNTPTNATAFRFSGDEFAYLFDDPLENQAESFALQILAFAEQSSIYYESIEIRISFSIGIARKNGENCPIADAMIALQEAKAMIGAKRYAVYSPNMEIFERQKNNLYWIPKVREAIDNQTIEAWYQPIVSNATGKIERYECLARLRDSVGNVADPYLFLEAAEISGILTAITKAMIAQSFESFDGAGLKFSINITDSDLQEGYLEDMLSFRLTRHNLKASQIALEIVETVKNRSIDLYIDQIERLKNMGFAIAADDFGAEYSNFMRLMAIDLDIIKIDGAFIKNIAIDARSEMIARNIVEFARGIGAKTTAEYVSDRNIYEKVKAIGIDYSQGFYFGKPSPKIRPPRSLL